MSLRFLGPGFGAWPRVFWGLSLGWTWEVSWASVSAELVPGSPAWPRVSPGCSCRWKASDQASVSFGGPLGTQRVTVPRLAASSAEGAWSKMDARAFRPGVIEVCPQQFVPTLWPAAVGGPIGLCVRPLRLMDRPSLQVGSMGSPTSSVFPLFWEVGRLTHWP